MMLKLRQIARTSLFAITFTLLTAAAWGQNQNQRGTIRGTVLDAVSGAPLAGTTIIIEGTNLGTATDGEGGFVISNITPGRVTVTARYLGYEVFRQTVTVEADRTITMRIPLHSQGINLQDVVVVAQINNEAESAVLSGQREALVATQAVGAAEMSRKGIGNARAAVAQVSGISRQEGVKNVFVRGLGDRYNATFLNGFPLPSEDPEYKNIALEFFGSDVIQSIGVSKVFGAAAGGDVAGAAIDIRSKELVGSRALSLSLEGGFNGAAVEKGTAFMKQDGVNYLGVSRTGQASAGRFDFPNSLDPRKIDIPLNHGYGASGGRRWLLGEKRNPLSVFVVGSHATDYSFTSEAVRFATAGDNVTQDQRGDKSTIGVSQLVLGNVDLRLDRRHEIAYNFVLVHANDQYVGNYRGVNYEDFQDADDEKSGFTLRQQNNDNLLVTHQLLTKWTLGERWQIDAGAAWNTIRGVEPDRRENKFSLKSSGQYLLTGSNSQKRFFSELRETDLNMRASVGFKLKRGLDFDKSNVTVGWRSRMVDNDFNAQEYDLGAYLEFVDGNAPGLDGLYNDANYRAGEFEMARGHDNSYNVKKHIHTAYVEATHQFTEKLSAALGLGLDAVDLAVDYNVETVAPGSKTIDKPYLLPSLNVRYDLNDRHALRLGASRSYTLPQAKEIAPYQYVNIGFVSEGNANLKPSDNYNADLKWDWYPSSSELVSLGVFYKRIVDPIGRVDIGGSARILSYDNISDRADVAGAEFEMRKNIVNTTTIRQSMRRLSVGVNASYIHSALDFRLTDPVRRTQLEGASPWLLNGDISYNWSSGERALNVAVVAGWFSDRIHTMGTRGFHDTIEQGVVTLSAVSSYRFNKYFTLKVQAGNLLNPTHRLTRGFVTKEGEIALSEYRKGVDVSVGVSFDIW
jgi:outer membrane receptor protein involved in Fe transport